VTGTNTDNSQIDSRLLVLPLCDQTDLLFKMANTGKWRQKVSYFAGDAYFGGD
jgi:hypothetical protein